MEGGRPSSNGIAEPMHDIHRMAVDEFLTWQRCVEGCYELVDGFIVPHPDYWSPQGFASPDNEHALILANLVGLLRAQLKPPCRVYPGAGTVVDRKDANVPDLSVSCRDDRMANALYEPRYVFEVSSPKTARIDTGRKVMDYLSITSVEAYVFVDRQNRTLTVYRPSRGPETIQAGSVDLADDVTLPLDDVFA